MGVHENEWKAQFMLLAEQTLDARRWRKTHFVITGPFKLCCLVAPFSCSSVVGSGWLCEHLSPRDVPRVSFHHLLHRRSENHSLVFWKGLISGRESSFFPFFSVLICYRWHFLAIPPKSEGSEWNLFRKMMLATPRLYSQDSEKISNKICVGFLCSWLYLGAVSEKRNHSVFQSSAAKWQYQRQDLKSSLKINSRQALAWDGDENGNDGSPIFPFPDLPATNGDTIAGSSTHPQKMFLLFLLRFSTSFCMFASI